MQIQWLNRVLWLSLGVTTLAALYLSRKPLCIDSRVVERLDRIDRESTETAYRCSQNRDGGWSATLARRLPSWSARVAETEEALWRIEPFRRPIRIAVLSHRPYAFRLQGGTLYIGEKLIEADGHLERGLIKAWLHERDPRLIDGDLAEEVYADFLQGMIAGSLVIEDPALELRTKLGSRWPQVLKDGAGYCASPWKLSEHHEICRKKDLKALNEHAWRLSLRPLLSSSLLAAWWDLPLRERIETYRSAGRWLRAGETLKEPGKDALAAAVGSLQAFQKAFSDQAAQEGASLMALSEGFSLKLRRFGFRETDAHVSLDVLILSDLPVPADSPFLKQLAEFATTRPSLKIAVKDPRNLALLPAGSRLKVSEIPSVKAERVAVLRCGRFDFDWVLSFENVAQKLFVVDVCGAKQPDLRSWIRQGPEGFATANQDFRFIQFHLPSLALKRDSLHAAGDVLTVIQKRDVADPVFRTLGWQELKWSQTANAYHPLGPVDAIEMFRLN